MAGLTPVLFAALVGLVPGPVVPPAGGGAAAPVSPVSPGDGGVRPLVPGGMRGPWDAQQPPPTPPVTDICQLFLKGRDQDTRFVGKTTAYLSAGWVGGSPLGWFDQVEGGGPLTGIGVYRDWGKSTVRRVERDGGCELDTRDQGTQFRLQGGWTAGLWSPYKRLEGGAAYVARLSPDLSVALGADLLAHGTGTENWAVGAAPEIRVTYNDWVGVRADVSFNLAGDGALADHQGQWLFEVFISKRFKADHFP